MKDELKHAAAGAALLAIYLIAISFFSFLIGQVI